MRDNLVFLKAPLLVQSLKQHRVLPWVWNCCGQSSCPKTKLGLKTVAHYDWRECIFSKTKSYALPSVVDLLNGLLL